MDYSNERDSTEAEWPSDLSCEAYGIAVRIRVSEAGLMPSLMENLPPGWKETARRPEVTYSLKVGKKAGQRYTLYCDDVLRLQTSRLRWVLDSFEAGVQHYIAEMSRNRVFVHAGVVGWQGRAILIPGRSFSGKTTLVRELVRLGAVYYSDEYAVLDPNGRVHPYPRALCVRRKDGAAQTKISASSLGGETGLKPLPIGLVVVSCFSSDAQWRPRRLTPGKGALEILSQTVPARRQPDRAIAAIGKIVTHAAVIKSMRGEAKQAARLVLKYLEQSRS